MQHMAYCRMQTVSRDLRLDLFNFMMEILPVYKMEKSAAQGSFLVNTHISLFPCSPALIYILYALSEISETCRNFNAPKFGDFHVSTTK